MAEQETKKTKKGSEKMKKGFPYGGMILSFFLIAVIAAAGFFGLKYMKAYGTVKTEYDSALQSAEEERDAAEAAYGDALPDSAYNKAVQKQVTEEMIAEAKSEIEAIQKKNDETDADIRAVEEKIAELQTAEGYDYFRAIYDEYVEGRAYIEELLSGD